jgi:hypothetical protein
MALSLLFGERGEACGPQPRALRLDHDDGKDT